MQEMKLASIDCNVDLINVESVSKKTGQPITYTCLVLDFGDGNVVKCFDKELISRCQQIALSLLIKKGGV